MRPVGRSGGAARAPAPGSEGHLLQAGGVGGGGGSYRGVGWGGKSLGGGVGQGVGGGGNL